MTCMMQVRRRRVMILLTCQTQQHNKLGAKMAFMLASERAHLQKNNNIIYMGKHRQ
jgi:hypothetical protein